MSEKTIEGRLIEDLDKVLIQASQADADLRQADADLRQAQDVCLRLDTEAQRLRMALFAIEGKADKNFGDANKANRERRMELKRGGDL